ncbi:biotin--[acetyl-CoA-carboxylase] ligase [candidate division WOR-3 bacterium]|nr:biotin--[acetyl-CoA-carboxylase] ligase [candidate division WOR-3 bacterium]
MIIGKKLYYFDSIDSTNLYARSLINKAPEGTVVLADQQTEGKGRFGKKWYSPEGGIWMSTILKPGNVSLISITAGVAVCETFHINGIILGLKWPNDILLNGKKVAGILTEIIDDTIILGIGINLNITKFPDELDGIASSIFLETKKHLDKKMICNLLYKQLDEFYSMLKNNMTFEILTKWRHYAVLLGKEVIVEMGDEKLSGRVLDINNNGALVIMRPNGRIDYILGGVCYMKKNDGRF